MGFKEDSLLIVRNPVHSHPARPAHIEVREIINVAKEKSASQPDKRSRAIIVEAQSTASPDAIALFPSYDAIRQRLQDKRVDKYKDYDHKKYLLF